MTIPHLMNCNHSEDGWCLDCVKSLHDEKDEMLQALEEIMSKSKCDVARHLAIHALRHESLRQLAAEAQELDMGY